MQLLETGFILPDDVLSTAENRTPATYFWELDRSVRRHFTSHSAFERLRNVFGVAEQSRVIKAVTEGEFSSFPLADVGRRRTLLDIARTVEEAKRRHIINTLDSGQTLGLTPSQQIVVKGFCEIANETLDPLERQWREEVIFSPLGQDIRFSKEHSHRTVGLSSRLKELGLGHPYAVLLPDSPKRQIDLRDLFAPEVKDYGLHEVVYTQRYKKEYEALAKRLQQMANDLSSLPAGAVDANVSHYIKFLQKWVDFCYCQDIEEIDKKAFRMDEAWMDLQDLFLIPPMETGFTPDGLRKDQWHSLAIIEQGRFPLQESCESQKEAILKYFVKEAAKRGTYPPVLRDSLPFLEKTTFLPVVVITRTMLFDARYSAQVLPNFDRQEIIEQKGRKTFLYLNDAEIIWQRMLRAWESVFDKESLKDFDDLTVEDWIVYYLVLHEAGETIAKNSSVAAKLVDFYGPLNEDRATSAGLATMAGLMRERKLSHQEIVKIAKLALLTAVFYLGLPVGTANFRHGQIQFNLARNCGLLHSSRDSLDSEVKTRVDWSKSSAYLAAVENHLWTKHLPLWASGADQTKEELTSLINSIFAA